MRGTLLMAISNKFGAMVVTTGNKSEVSVGYATLYGDMNGGFNPIKDLYKMQVYALSRLRNGARPKGCLGPGGVGHPRKHHHQGADRRAARKPDRPGFAAALRRARRHSGRVLWNAKCRSAKSLRVDMLSETVKKVERLLYLAEYKRRQAAPGVKITDRNFGRDRRYPITNRFREIV